MKFLTFLVLVPFIPAIISAQQVVNYNDVAVIINDSSQTSIDIGNYFQEQRNIPDENIIHISATTNEEIDSLEFQQIRLQIEEHLTSNNLIDSINYIVTTKGVPLKVAKDSCDIPGFQNCASFDSELSLIMGSLSSEISNFSGALNPYYNVNDHFSREDYGIYLVTRLDGYKKDDVINLIDRSGPNTIVNQLETNSIFDISYLNDSLPLILFTNQMEESMDSLTAQGWDTTFHPDTQLLTNQENIFAYFSVNYQPSNQVLNNTWVEGSITEIMWSHSASTFEHTNNVNNDLLIADLIYEGATGAHGYAYYTFSSSSLKTNILFSTYIDTTNHYNLAESYYMSMLQLSWQDVVIGDPKTSIIIDYTNAIDEIDYSNNINVYPNPSRGNFIINAIDIQVNSIKVYLQTGQLIYLENSGINSENIQIDLSNQSNGIYFINVETDKGPINKKVLISK